MTQSRAYILTGIAAGLYLFLSWAFADGLFSLSNFWDSDVISDSSLFTYVLFIAIIAIGVRYAQSLPAEAAADEPAPSSEVRTPGQVEDPVLWKRLLGDAHWAIIWLPIRFFVGRAWLSAGEAHLRSDAWMDGGAAVQGYWQNAVAIPEQGRPAITYGWYRDFLQYMLDNEWYTWAAPMIAIGEFVVGITLIVGALVGISAFLGTILNFNFQLAGSASSNPVLFGLGVFLVLAWKVAGYWGLDRYLLSALGVPWSPGRLLSRGQEGPDREASSTA